MQNSYSVGKFSLFDTNTLCPAGAQRITLKIACIGEKAVIGQFLNVVLYYFLLLNNLYRRVIEVDRLSFEKIQFPFVQLHDTTLNKLFCTWK